MVLKLYRYTRNADSLACSFRETTKSRKGCKEDIVRRKLLRNPHAFARVFLGGPRYQHSACVGAIRLDNLVTIQFRYSRCKPKPVNHESHLKHKRFGDEEAGRTLH